MSALRSKSDTLSIVSSEKGQGILYLGDPEPAWISTRSRFGDLIWILDQYTPGQPMAAGVLDWDFGIRDGLRFGHEDCGQLRSTLKRFVWSLLCERANGLPLTAGSIRKVSTGIKTLVRWMFHNGYRGLSDISSDASEEFLEDLQGGCRALLTSGSLGENDGDESAEDEEYRDLEDEDAEIGIGYLRPRLQIWGHLWDQRDVMLRFGTDALPEKPFSGRSARSLADDLATKAEGWIPPVPDEVALPVMREARRWVMERANDILALQNAYLDAYDKTAVLCDDRRAILAKDALEAFSFSIDRTTCRAWREGIQPANRLTLHRGSWRAAQLSSHEVFRTLVEDLCAACVIVIQSEAGPRINEICGLKARGPAKEALATNVEVRVSKTGLNEHFFLKGLLSKMQQGPREVEWLIGSRPRGSDDMPAPVRAAWVLERLFEPMRERAVDASLRDSLILQFTAPRGYPRDGQHLGRVLGMRLRKLQRQFVGNNVDLSGLPDRNRQGENLTAYRESKGASLLTHSWRKSFALYVFRTDPRMTAAIAQQFHHLSLAMTEEGYLGNDPTLIEVMDSVRQEQTALVFYELARGERPAAGRVAKLVDEYREELAELTAGASRAEGLEAARRWVVREDLRIWFSKHGKCFITLAPSRSRCHQLGDSNHWSNGQPNFSYRTPDACLGCALYAIDAEHAPFWLARFRENAQWLSSETASGGARMVAELRMRQSEAVLRAIGIDAHELEEAGA